MNPLLLAATLVAGTLPPPDAERVVLQTSAGGMILSLHSGAAPRTVEHFKKLVAAGVYEGMRFYRSEQGYIVQTSIAEDRDRPLTAEQRDLLRRVPHEANPTRQIRGAISLAHAPGDRDGGISSFCIALAPAEDLEGEYAVFASVEEGFDVLDEIASVPVNAAHEPLLYVGIEHAEVAPNLEAARQIRWPRRSLYSATVAASEKGIRREVAALIATMLFCTLAICALGRKASDRWLRSVRMLVLLLGGFGLVVSLLPLGQRAPLVGAATFLGLVALFKVMNRFEAPPETAAPEAK
jgi:cyclophilin family peptidyl-prolyl cis-trans isomerase